MPLAKILFSNVAKWLKLYNHQVKFLIFFQVSNSNRNIFISSGLASHKAAIGKYLELHKAQLKMDLPTSSLRLLAVPDDYRTSVTSWSLTGDCSKLLETASISLLLEIPPCSPLLLQSPQGTKRLKVLQSYVIT